METTATSPRRLNLTGTLTRVFETDFTQPAAFFTLAMVFLLARVPYMNYGHGTDPDAWRVALTAHHLLDTGKYFPSRLPGNPLHELTMTLFIPAGWIGTNIATALAALVGVYLFARIVAFHRLPNPGLLTIGFAFTPLLYINSIATMDYMWTLTFILGAYYSVLRRSPLLAGVCLGLAVGFRLQSVIAFLPLAYLLWKQGQLRNVVPFGLAVAGIATLAFAPVLAVYGVDFYNFYDASVSYRDVLRLLGKEALGVGGVLGVMAGATLSFARLKRLPLDALREPVIAAWLGFIFFYFVTFFRLPHEIAYLIPVFPFGFLLMGRYFTRLALTGAVAAILVAGLVDITTPGEGLDLESVKSASVGRGLILSNGVTMEAQHAFADEVLSSPVPDHSIVMAGFVYPQLAVRTRRDLDIKIIERDYGAISMLSDRGEAVDGERDVRYVWLLTYEAFIALRSQGYSFYVVPDAVGGTAALYGYRPPLFGASFLKLDRAAPSAGKGTASTDR